MRPLAGILGATAVLGVLTDSFVESVVLTLGALLFLWGVEALPVFERKDRT